MKERGRLGLEEKKKEIKKAEYREGEERERRGEGKEREQRREIQGVRKKTLK